MPDNGQGNGGTENGGTNNGGTNNGGGNVVPWHTNRVAAEHLGHLQNLGLHDKPVEEVAATVLKSHYEAQKLLGVPADRILKLPTKPAAEDPAAWNDVWAKLGAPSKAEDYDFTGIKFKDGSELEEGFTTFLRQQAAGLHLPKDAARALGDALVKYMDGASEAETTERTANLAKAKDALAKNWGKNFEANKFVASQAAAKFGFTPQEVAELENLVGYDNIMERFRKIGTAIGDDIFVTNDGKGVGDNNVMTREQAQARKSELMADAEWVKRYTAGGKKELNEMIAINTLLSA